MAVFYDTDRPLFVPGPLADICGMLRTWDFDERAVMDHHDKYAALFDRLATAPVYNPKLDADDFIPVNQAVLKDLVGSRYAKAVLHNCQIHGLIECDNRFDHRTGKSLGYRFAPAFRGKLLRLNFLKPESLGRKLDRRTAAAWATGEATGDRLLARIGRDVHQLRIHRAAALAANEQVYACTLGFLAGHKTLLSSAKCPKKRYGYLLDLAKATDEAIALPAHAEVASRLKTARKKALAAGQPLALTWYGALLENVYASHARNLVTVERLASGHFQDVTRPDPRSRVFTTLTSLATPSRAFLYHAQYPGEKLFNLDIRNSQPFLLNVLLQRRYQDQALPADAACYRRETAAGAFYNLAADAHGLQAEEYRARKEFKGKMFGSVFFCKTKHTEGSRLGQWFMANYPSVYALVRAGKAESYKHLAVELQRIEAGLVVDTVLPALHQRGIWAASIHDSVVVRERDVPVAEALLRAAFAEAAGLAPTVEPEWLAKNLARTSAAARPAGPEKATPPPSPIPPQADEIHPTRRRPLRQLQTPAQGIWPEQSPVPGSARSGSGPHPQQPMPRRPDVLLGGLPGLLRRRGAGPTPARLANPHDLTQ
ncbi:hypothetical protein [Hymenobacter sp.]|uniref:hypothetical protein n=1 Tax=Hymenobacter sp. TaxID=1898978 RepID=UPI00286C335C|nr:hypothetical protein [Hymenobacter sp.]